MTSISIELGRTVEMDEVKNALVTGFEKAFGITACRSSLTTEEKELARNLSEEKYGKGVFTFQR